MANILKAEKQEAVIHHLIEGCSIRATERITGVHRDTIMRLGVSVGEACGKLMDGMMRDLPCQHLEVDEIWGFVGKKERMVGPEDNPAEVGDAWTFVAIDADSKLIPSWKVGKRDGATANAFIADLRGRLAKRVQLSSDGLRVYVDAVEQAFGADVDYGQIVKVFEADAAGPGRYSPPRVTGVERTTIMGVPFRVGTSHVERQNLTMRMQIRRLTRLTNAFSKKMENLRAAVSLHFAHYNMVRVHKSLRVTPAMEAGVTDRIWTLGELLEAARA